MSVGIVRTVGRPSVSTNASAVVPRLDITAFPNTASGLLGVALCRAVLADEYCGQSSANPYVPKADKRESLLASYPFWFPKIEVDATIPFQILKVTRKDEAYACGPKKETVLPLHLAKACSVWPAACLSSVGPRLGTAGRRYTSQGRAGAG
jgi:hypothetical protein